MRIHVEHIKDITQYMSSKLRFMHMFMPKYRLNTSNKRYFKFKDVTISLYNQILLIKFKWRSYNDQKKNLKRVIKFQLHGSKWMLTLYRLVFLQCRQRPLLHSVVDLIITWDAYKKFKSACEKLNAFLSAFGPREPLWLLVMFISVIQVYIKKLRT